jgi:DNA-binding protein YbaB
LADLGRQREAVGTFQQELAEATTTVAPRNRSISVTVDGQGELVDIKFPSQSYRTMAPAELGRLIVDTVTEARAEARDKAVAMLRDLAPTGLPVGDILRGPVDLDTAMERMDEVMRGAGLGTTDRPTS